MNVYVSMYVRLTAPGQLLAEDRAVEFTRTYPDSFVPRVGDYFIYDEDYALQPIGRVAINLDDRQAEVCVTEVVFKNPDDYYLLIKAMMKGGWKARGRDAE